MKYEIQSDKEYYKQFGFDTDIAKIYINDLSFSFFKKGEKIEANDIDYSEIAKNDTIISDDILKEIDAEIFFDSLKEYFSENKISIILEINDKKAEEYFLLNGFEEKVKNKDCKILRGIT